MVRVVVLIAELVMGCLGHAGTHGEGTSPDGQGQGQLSGRPSKSRLCSLSVEPGSWSTGLRCQISKEQHKSGLEQWRTECHAAGNMDLPIPVTKWHFVLPLACVKAHTSFLLWRLSADEAEIPDPYTNTH